MRAEARAAKRLPPGEHITIAGYPGFRILSSEGPMHFVFAVLRWLLAAPLSLFLVSIAWLTAPLLALTAFGTEDPVTKQGNLPRWLIWFQTHDYPLDEIWRPSTPAEPWRAPDLYLKGFATLAHKTAADFEAHAGLRWWARTLWLWRNPAYGWRAYALGYRHMPGDLTTVRKWGDWNVKGSSVELYTASRPGPLLTRAAWGVRSKLFYTRSRYVRINIGWKLVMPGIAMLAVHVHPARKWKQGR